MPVSAVQSTRDPLKLAGMFLLVAAACAAAEMLMPDGGEMAGIWLANGLTVGLLLRMPIRHWWPMAIAGYCGNVCANLLFGFPLDLAISLALCNAVEVSLAVALLRHRTQGPLDLSRPRHLIDFALLGVLLAPLVPSLMAGFILADHSGVDVLQAAAIWYPADVLGMAIVAPLLLSLPVGELSLAHPWATLRRWAPASAVLLGATLAAYAFAVLGQLPPLLFLTFPPLLYMVLRHGTPGAVVGPAMLTLVSFGILMLPRPDDTPLAGVSEQVRLLLLQAYLACATGIALAMATLLEQRRGAVQELQQAARRLREITDHLPAYISYLDHEQRFRFANNYYSKGYGLAADDMIGRGVGELFPASLLEDFAAPLQEVMQGSPVCFERTADELAGEVHQRVDLVPDIDERGAVVGFYSLVLDITERKRAELRQAASEERLRTIADNLPVAIAYIDSRRIYRFCNRTHQLWFGGAATDDAIGRHMERVLPPEVIEAQRYYIDCAMQGARTEGSFVLQLRGQALHVQVCCVPDRAADGEVRGIYMMLSDITAAKRGEQRLQQLARFDPLTGLANRRELHEHLGAALNRIQRYGGSLALLFIDVDHFKGINDRYGHAGGDEVLQELALRLRGGVRGTDTVARVAGDEFVVVLEQLRSNEEPQFVARKLLAMIGKPFVLDQGPLQVGVSIGIAVGHPGDSAELLLRRADRALYAAKDGGRNTSRVAE